MTPEILICSRKDADKRLPGDFAAVVSINDRDDRPPYRVRRYRGMKCVLTFDDVSHLNQERFGYLCCTSRDIERLINFARSPGPYLIHCAAGISRSSAAAIIVRAVNNPGHDPDDILRQTIDTAWHWPNLLMLRTADDILGTELEPAAESWQGAVSASGCIS